MKQSCLLFLLVTTVFACQHPATPGIYADIYVRYEQGERKIKAEATFFKGETPETAKSIVFQNGVGFLGSGMEARTLPGGVERYEFETVASLPELVPIHFTDDQGKEKNIDFHIQAIREFEFLTVPVKKTEGFSLKLDADPLSGNEKLVLIFTDSKNQSLTLEVNAASATQQIDFAPGQLKRLEAGNVQVYLVRTGNISKKEGRYSIDIQTEYYSNTKSIELE